LIECLLSHFIVEFTGFAWRQVRAIAEIFNHETSFVFLTALRTNPKRDDQLIPCPRQLMKAR
jgi:Mn-dependent DtxR family transcriptional regulator